jgi:hypothetical protein
MSSGGYGSLGFAVEAFPVDFKVRAKALTPMDF